MDTMDKTHSTSWESFQLESSQLVEQVKRLIHEGNVRRIVVKQDGRTLVEFPLAVGVVGTLLAAPLAALGALAALLNDCTLEVEREEPAPVAELQAVEIETDPTSTLPPVAQYEEDDKSMGEFTVAHAEDSQANAEQAMAPTGDAQSDILDDQPTAMQPTSTLVS